MRFMIIVKATRDSGAGAEPPEALIERTAAYHEALVKAGVLLDAAALAPSSAGWRIVFDGERRSVVEGPFEDAAGLVAGYAVLQVKTREEALEWARRFPNPAPHGGKAEIEVRRLFEPELEPARGAERLPNRGARKR